MDLKSLKAMGALTSRSLVKKDVAVRYPVPLPQDQWANPEVAEYPDPMVYEETTIETHIQKKSSADFIEMMQARDSEKGFIAVFRCVRQADGSQVFDTFEQVMALNEWLWIPLMRAVYEVNEFSPKNSRPRTSSGAKSRLPSAAAPSRNGKKRLVKKSGLSGSPIAPTPAP